MFNIKLNIYIYRIYITIVLIKCNKYFFRANPAFNPYYYGYTPYPVYPQQYPYPYPYIQNDGAQAPPPAQPGGWGEYFGSFFNYIPNFPLTSESQTTSETESQGGSAESSAESGCNK